MGFKDKTVQTLRSEISWYSSNNLFSGAICFAEYMMRIANDTGT